MLSITRKKNRLFSLAIPAALLLALMIVSPVYAESETPPPPAPVTETVVSDPAVVPDAAPAPTPPAETPVVDPVVEPALDAVVPPAATEPPAEAPPAVTETPAETPVVDPVVEPALDAVVPPAATEPPAEVPPAVTETPAETPVVEPVVEPALDETVITEAALVDGNGEPLTLATAESAEILATGDPYFIVGLKTYRYMLPGGCSDYGGHGSVSSTAECWESTTPISAAITKVGNGFLPTDGKIYVLSGTYDEPSGVNIDGSTNSFLANLKGLIGLDGSASTIINGNVSVINSLLGFTLSGFTINGDAINPAVAITNTTGTVILNDLDVHNESGGGIYVYNKGSIAVTDVESSNNKEYGASINSWGSPLYTVTIKNSEFDDNIGYSEDMVGLEMATYGPVTLDGVSASRNHGVGADFYRFSSLTIKNSVFNENFGDTSSGFGIGLHVLNYLVAPVSLTNVMADDNQNSNIYIFTLGSVTGTNIEALRSHTGHGMFIDNSSGLSTAVVTLTNGTFNQNAKCGLNVLSKGNITLANILANGNSISSGWLEDISTTGKTQNEHLGPYNEADEWWFSVSDTDVVSIKVGTDGNFTPSIQIYDESKNLLKSVDGSGSNITTTFTPPTVGNFFVVVNGGYGNYALSLNDNAGSNPIEMNQSNGIYLDNCIWNGSTACLGSGTISLGAAFIGGYANQFAGNNVNGLEAYSKGNVTISNFDSFDNGSYGVFVNNGRGAAIGNVTVNVAFASTPNFNWTNGIWNNRADGLYINSKGTILVDKASVDNNAGDGIRLNNSTATMTVSNSYSNSNANHGLYITSLGSVSITNATFDNNSNTGLIINSNGAITLNGVQANGNDLSYHSIKPGGMTVYDWLSHEGAPDVWWFNAPSTAPITISLDSTALDAYLEVYADDGSGNMVLIASDDNSGGIKNALLTFTPVDGKFYMIYAKSVVDATGLYTLAVYPAANDPSNNIIKAYAAGVELNGGSGAVTILNNPTRGFGTSTLNNTSGGIGIEAVGLVTLNNIWSNNNTLGGLEVFTRGNITLTNGTFENNGSGVWLDNCLLSSGLCTGTGNVTVTAPAGKMNHFNHNYIHGMEIFSKGSVSLTNVEAMRNGGRGVELTNNYTGSIGSVTITATPGTYNDFSFNGLDGNLQVYSFGAISVNQTHADAGNGRDSENGAWLDNYGSLLLVKPPVTVTNSTFNGYEGTGLTINTKGAVTLSGVEASNNSYHNVYLDTNPIITIYEYLSPSVYDPVTGWWTGGDDQYHFTGDTEDITITITSDDFNPSIRVWGEGVDMCIGDTHEDGMVTCTFTTDDLVEYDISVNAYNSNKGGNYKIYFNDNIVTPTHVHDPYISGISVDGCPKGGDVSDCTGSGAVTVTKSAVVGYGTRTSNNKDDGLYINALGAVSLTNITSKQNGNAGLIISKDTSPSAAITLNTVTLDNNSAVGLVAYTKGAFSWTTGSASGNLHEGGAGIFNNGILATSLSGVNLNNNGGEDGLFIWSKGAITLSGISAQWNGGDGVNLNNSAYVIPPVIPLVIPPVVPAVSITNGTFSNNASYGLQVDSKGAITLSGISAQWNGGNGVDLNNSFYNGTLVIRPAVGITNGNFNYNTGNGLVVLSKGNITLTNVNANENYYSSGWLDSTGQTQYGHIAGYYADEWWFTASHDVPILIEVDSNSFTPWFEVFDELGNFISSGTVVGSQAELDFIPDSDGNFYVRLGGSSGLNGLYDISLNDTSHSKIGYISVNNGAYLNNCLWNGTVCQGSGGVTITAPAGVMNHFNDNPSHGLMIDSKGSVSLTNVEATSNDGGGVEIYTNYASSIGAVSIAATPGTYNNFSHNGYDGNLRVYSFGAISVNLVHVDGGDGQNSYMGAWLDNYGAPTAKTVAVTNSTFNGYEGTGLTINTKGAVTLSGVEASDNSTHDLYLGDNPSTTWIDYISPAVYDVASDTWNGGMDFYHFTGDGNDAIITVHSDDFYPGFNISLDGDYEWYGDEDQDGSVTFTIVDTEMGKEYGINVYNSRGNASGNYDISFNDEPQDHIFDYGISGIVVDGCYDVGGVWTCTGSGAVTVTKSAVVGYGTRTSNNKDDGLYINALGAVSLTNITSKQNGNAGLIISKDTSPSAAITLNTVTLDNNSAVGLVAYTNGAFSWTTGSASGNLHEGGAGIFNYGATTATTLSGVNTNNNGVMTGLFISVKGPVTLTNVSSSGNTDGAPGAMVLYYDPLLMEFTSTGGAVSITNGTFNHNSNFGLQVDAKGAITLSGVSTQWNGGDGADLDNSWYDGLLVIRPAVSITNGNFNFNIGNGLSVFSKGNIILTNVNAYGNSISSGELDSTGQTQYEHIGDYNDNDEWQFDGEHDMPILIEVDSAYFNPWFEVFEMYWNGSEWQQGNWLGRADGDGSHAELDFTPDWNGKFLVRLGGGSGLYDISLEDNAHSHETLIDGFRGASLDNCLAYEPDPILHPGVYACAGTGNVTIVSNAAIISAVQNYFSGNNADGLFINSRGIVSVTNANASTNGETGLNIYNDGGTGAVTVTNTSTTTRGFFRDNIGDGVKVLSRGAITLNNSMSSWNGGFGADLDNQTASLPAAVSVTKGYFSGNQYHGLRVLATGAITVMDVWGNNNGWSGVFLSNSDAVTVQPITVKRSFFYQNTMFGLYVKARGLITVDNILAQYNGDSGAYLSNDFDGATGGVLINSTLGENQFVENRGDGLTVETRKAVSGSKITAQDNQGYGVFIDNCHYAGGVCVGGGAGSATLTTVVVRNNGQDGLFVDVVGGASLNYVTSLRNGWNSGDGDGIKVFATLPVSITNGVCQYNWGSGLDVTLPLPYNAILTYTYYMGNDVDNSGDPNKLISRSR